MLYARAMGQIITRYTLILSSSRRYARLCCFGFVFRHNLYSVWLLQLVLCVKLYSAVLRGNLLLCYVCVYEVVIAVSDSKPSLLDRTPVLRT